ncbi:MAG: DUF2070 family protein [Ignisphaera sp.]
MFDGLTLKYYRFLRVPTSIARKYYIAYIIFFALLVIADVYPSIINRSINLIFISMIMLLHIISTVLLSISMKVIVRYMKMRQIINAMVITTSLGIPLEFASSYIRLYGISYAVIPLIGSIVFVHLAGLFNGIAYTTAMPLAIETMFSYVNNEGLKFLSVRYSLVVLLQLASLTIIRSLKRHKGYNVLRIANAWLKFMLSGDGGDLEEALDNIGVEFDAQTKVLLFDRGSDAIALITPTIHFGPYRTIGSTLLPYDIESSLESKGFKVFVFHGAGSHELDLTKRSYGTLLASELSLRLSKERRDMPTELVYEPFRVFNGFREAMVLQTDTTSMLIITPVAIGGDDMPYELQPIAEDIAKLYGFRDAIVVDAHNVEGKRDTNVSSFDSLIKAGISRRSRVCEELLVGYGESRIRDYVKGVCRNKVKVLTIKCNENLYSIIYLYGNNAKIGVRENLRKVALENGYKDAEIVTLDDHSCAGITFDAPYHSIDVNNSLIESIKRALESSLHDLKPASCKYTRYVFRVKVAGNKIFELLNIATDIGSLLLKYLKTSLPVLYSAWLAITILILFYV